MEKPRKSIKLETIRRIVREEIDRIIVESDDLDEIARDEDLDEVTPPGGEKVVRALKKEPGVKNPWAIAWSMKKKGQI